MIHPATGSVSAPIEEGVPFPWLFRGALAILLLALLIFQQAQVLTLALLLVAPFGAGYAWSYREVPYPLGGRGVFFTGIPTGAAA